MSSFLWLLFYLVPLLALTAAIFAWFGWQWRGSDLLKRLQELQAQIDQTPRRQAEIAQAHATELAGVLSELDQVRAAHAATATELASLRATTAANPAASATKPRRKRSTTAKSKTPAAPNAASLRATITMLESQLSSQQADLATAARERLQQQIQVLLQVEAETATLADVPDDDLTRIKGIKKITSEQLRAHGIRTWRQIARWTDQEQRAFSELLAFKNRVTREQWQAQARALHAAAHGTLP